MATQEGMPRYSGRWTVQLTQEMLDQAREKVRIEFNGDRQAFLRQAIHDALHGRGQETEGMANIQQDFEELLTHTRRTPQEITELKRLLQNIESHLIAVGDRPDVGYTQILSHQAVQQTLQEVGGAREILSNVQDGVEGLKKALADGGRGSRDRVFGTFFLSAFVVSAAMVLGHLLAAA